MTADLCEKVGVKNVTVIGCQSVYYAMSRNAPAEFRHRERTSRSTASITGGLNNTDMIEFCLKNQVDIIGQDEFAEHQIALGRLSRDEFLGRTGSYVLPSSIRDGMNLTVIPLEDYHDYCLKHFHKFFEIEPWTEHIRKNYDFAFGTRFHGNVAALQAGVPALWMTHDTRTVELCRHFRLPSIKAQDFWAYRSIAELKEVTDYAAFKARLPGLIGDFFAYLQRNDVHDALKPEFVSGLEVWRA